MKHEFRVEAEVTHTIQLFIEADNLAEAEDAARDSLENDAELGEILETDISYVTAYSADSQ